jgi:hypothetical protein
MRSRKHEIQRAKYSGLLNKKQSLFINSVTGLVVAFDKKIVS